MKKTLLLFLLVLAVGSFAIAQSRVSNLELDKDPRGKPELVICNQNLQNFGSFANFKARTRKDRDEYRQKTKALAQRFAKADCDLIAYQELIGLNDEEAEKGGKELASAMAAIDARTWDYKLGPTNDSWSRVGYLFAVDRAKILNTISYSRVELPKLSEKQKPRKFVRGPFEAQFLVKGRDGSKSKVVTFVNFHFKSKRGGKSDPTALEWETYRMEMAEAVRRVVESRHADSFSTGQTVLVVLGDRNSHFDSASAKILEGTLKLSHFKGTAPCRLGSRGVPLCKPNVVHPQKLFSVLTNDPQTRFKPGTIEYKGVHSWIDDILMPAESLPYAWTDYATEGDFNSGVYYLPEEASDHALTWVVLNWQ